MRRVGKEYDNGMPTENNARASIIPRHGVGRLVPFQPGQSGNPGGRPRGMREVREICRQACPDAAYMLADFVRLRDEHGHHPEKDGRVLAVVTQTLFTWAYGKPPDYDPNEDRPPMTINTAILSREERAMMISVLRRGLLTPAAEENAEPPQRVDEKAERQG